MAKKQPPKPLFPLKHDFVDSLDNYILQASSLASAVGMLVRGNDLTGPVADILKERLAAFDAARNGDD